MAKRITRISGGIGFKLLFIIALVGLLAIFLAQQDGMVGERRALRDEAVNRTVSEWGGQQSIAGPLLRIPYREIIATSKDGDTYRDSWAYVLPEDFSATTTMTGEKRSRGIYEIPLYVAEVAMAGSFRIPGRDDWIPADATVFWDKTELWFFLGSARGLAERPLLSYQGMPMESTRATMPDGNPTLDSFSVRVPRPVEGERTAFNLKLTLKGGQSWGIFPAGRDSRISVRSDLGFPEFGGSFLPLNRTVNPQGFAAEWKIPALARAIPQAGTVYEWHTMAEKLVYAGFELGVAFDSYRLINRALKYGLLFIVVPFVGLFLYEIFARRRLHPIQYLMVGLAVIMFYLLLLSLSERMDFGLSFILGGMAICVLLGLYCAAILRGGWAGLWCGVGMAGLYGLLYLIISSEDNALMVGSFFLFGLLALIMMSTRRLDWYRIGGGRQAETVEPSESDQTEVQM